MNIGATLHNEWPKRCLSKGTIRPNRYLKRAKVVKFVRAAKFICKNRPKSDIFCKDFVRNGFFIPKNMYLCTHL